MATIILPKRLNDKLKKKTAEETGTLPEELAVEVLCKDLNEELDPEELGEHYQALSEKYLAEAKEFLSKTELLQTSEKLWGGVCTCGEECCGKKRIKVGKTWQSVGFCE